MKIYLTIIMEVALAIIMIGSLTIIMKISLTIIIEETLTIIMKGNFTIFFMKWTLTLVTLFLTDIYNHFTSHFICCFILNCMHVFFLDLYYDLYFALHIIVGGCYYMKSLKNIKTVNVLFFLLYKLKYIQRHKLTCCQEVKGE